MYQKSDATSTRILLLVVFDINQVWEMHRYTTRAAQGDDARVTAAARSSYFFFVSHFYSAAPP